jgi:hypothetical protein
LLSIAIAVLFVTAIDGEEGVGIEVVAGEVDRGT